MTKILLVEDDKSLREIYGVRLLAEGYQIVSAGDGEQALAMAIKEHPDLVISDVMMPKISGFDMLDILRTTPETKDLKVIMMTALSSEDQRARGESLGANRYLVKSQVGIEDVVRTVHDVLADAPTSTAPAGSIFSTPMAKPIPTPVQQPVAAPVAPVIEPTPAPQPMAVPTPITISAPTTMPTPTPVQQPQPTPEPIVMPTPTPMPTQPVFQPAQPMPQPTAPFSTPTNSTFRPTLAPAPAGERTINPMPSNSQPIDISALINQELNGMAQPPADQPPQI